MADNSLSKSGNVAPGRVCSKGDQGALKENRYARVKDMQTDLPRSSRPCPSILPKLGDSEKSALPKGGSGFLALASKSFHPGSNQTANILARNAQGGRKFKSRCGHESRRALSFILISS